MACRQTYNFLFGWITVGWCAERGERAVLTSAQSMVVPFIHHHQFHQASIIKVKHIREPRGENLVIA